MEPTYAISITDLIERLQSKLSTQTRALEMTVLQIGDITAMAPKSTKILADLRVKRNRQADAVAATTEYLELLNRQLELLKQAAADAAAAKAKTKK